MLEGSARFASIKEASRITGLSQYFIRAGCRAGTIPHIMCGNRYKVDLQRMQDHLDSQTEKRA